MSGVLIIGGGQGGARCAVELRSAGFQEPITILTDERYLPYERPPLSKEVLADGATAGEPQVVPAEELEDAGIVVRLNVRAQSIDPAIKQVDTATGQLYEYDHLVVATGATARRGSTLGAELQGVLTLRDAPDALLLRERLALARRVAIIGGGVLGLEIAASARRLGAEVVVIEQAERCLERMLPPQAVTPIMNLHQENGVRIKCGAQVERILGPHKASGIKLQNGETIECDLVVLAIGSVPNDALVSKAGGECAGGVLVDERCRTTLPDVFAIGDVARDRVTGARPESWDNANRQATIVAAAITGAPLPSPVPPWFWTDQYDLNLQVIGTPLAGDLLIERVGDSARQTVQFYLRDGAVSGAVLFNSGRDRRVVTQLIGHHIAPAELSSAKTLKQLIQR